MAKKFLTGLNLVVLDNDPSTGSEGELYFNSSASVAKIYQAGAWSVLGAGGGGGGITVSDTEPSSPQTGDAWYKNDTGELYVFDGTYWVEVNGTISLSQEDVQDYVAPLFTNATNTNVIATYDDENNVINLNTSGSLVSVDSIVYPDYITFDTTPEIAPTETGSMFWDPGDGLLKVLLNESQIELGLGQEQVALVKNATGSTIAKGKVVYINGAQGQRPTIALSDSDLETTSSKTIGLTAESIADGAEGFVTTFGVLRGVNTDGLTEGSALWLSSTPGGYQTAIPDEPSHLVFVGYVVKVHASAGEIFVNPQNGYELNELHGVTVSASVSNNELLAYNSSNGLWINKTAAQAGLATSTDLVDYLTINDAALLYQPTSLRLTSIVNLEDAAGFLVSDGSNSYTIDASEYLTTSDASATYLEQSDAANIYLTQTDAANTYLTTASAVSTYQPLDQDLTAISSVSGSGFLRRNITNTWEFDSNTYLTTYDAGTTYQPIGNYATINGVETLTNKTMSSAFVNDILTFDDGANSSTIDVTGDNLTINGYDNLYLTTTVGSIILQPDHFVKIYDEYVATQEWVNFQDYLTQSSASSTYQPIGNYSTTSHNHTLNSLSNVVITGTPTDGQAIVWDTATSKWVNETVAAGDAFPSQTGNNGKFLQTDGTNVSWQGIDLSTYQPLNQKLTDISNINLTAHGGPEYYGLVGVAVNGDSLELLDINIADYLTSTINQSISVTDTTQSTSPTSGALIVSGGVGISKDLWIDGNLHVNGTTSTLHTTTVSTNDNIIYLNTAQDATITNAVGDGTYVTYTADNTYTVGMDIRVTGMDPSAYNISSADGLTIYSATSTQFVVAKTTTGSFVSGGIAHAKTESNADLGFAGGYYNAGYAHAGLFRDSSDGIFKFFQGYTPEPDESVNIDTGHASFALAKIAISGIDTLGFLYNFGIGNYALNNATGESNFAIGWSALQSNSGSYNFAIGPGAMLSNSGSFNQAFGNSALYSNTGDNNLAIGENALYSNTGANNSAFGKYALNGNTAGDHNIAVGQEALSYNSYGAYNIAIGENALTDNSFGDNNIALGSSALRSNQGDNNIAIGPSSLRAVTGSYNTAIGFSAGYDSMSSGTVGGNSNIFIGSYSGSQLLYGNYNVIIGSSNGSTYNYTNNNIIISDGEGNERAKYLSADSGWTLGTIVSGTWNGTEIGYAYGGTGLTTLGTSGQVLTVNSSATGLEWANVSGGSSFTNSSEFAALISDETGSGSVVFSDSPTLITPNIGAATGTSLTTTGNVVSHVDISTPTFVTNSYTVSSTDDGKLLMLDNSSTAGNLLIPTDATYDFPVGTQINVVQKGTGLITVAAVDSGTTTLNYTPGAKLRAQWSSAAIVKTAANTWLLMGDLTV